MLCHQRVASEELIILRQWDHVFVYTLRRKSVRKSTLSNVKKICMIDFLRGWLLL